MQETSSESQNLGIIAAAARVTESSDRVYIEQFSLDSTSSYLLYNYGNSITFFLRKKKTH